jgi:hypothetical protein
MKIRADVLTRLPTADYSREDVGTAWPTIKRAKEDFRRKMTTVPDPCTLITDY